MAFQGPPAFASWFEEILNGPECCTTERHHSGGCHRAAASSQLRANNINVDGSSLVVDERWGPQRPGQGRPGQGSGFPGRLALCTRADEVISIKSSVGGVRSTGAGLGWAGLAGLAPLLHLDIGIQDE